MKKNYKPLIAAILALLFYTGTDILIWQRIFETHQMVEYANAYHAGWLFSLFGYATIGVLFMWGIWKDCIYFLITLFVTAFSGLEDVLYYVLDRKPMPHSLPWLQNNPMIFNSSRAGVVGSALFWLASLVILYTFFYLRKNNSSPEDIPVS